MAITGTADLFEKHIPYVKKSRVILEYGEPIDVKALSKEEKKKLGGYCQSVIADMLRGHQNM
jgi:1-acyl-sn-glycerol-3-phosphate acyltransferase